MNYSKDEHNLWVNEVKEIYGKVKSHQDSYKLDFLDFEIEIFPNVFSPKYINNTRWYAEMLPEIIEKKSLLEIGTGTGAIAIQCSLKGSSVSATEINKAALDCAKANFSRNDCNIPIFYSDVYERIPNDQKFDYIFWNHPYNNSPKTINDDLMIAGFDYNYNSLRKYIVGADVYLTNPNKGLLLGTGGQADMNSILKIAKDNGYEMVLLKFVKMPLGIGTLAPNDFRIYELKR